MCYTQGREKQHHSVPRWNKFCTSDDGGDSALPPLQGHILQPFQCCLKHMVEKSNMLHTCRKSPHTENCPLIAVPNSPAQAESHCCVDHSWCMAVRSTVVGMGNWGGQSRRGVTGGEVWWKWWTTNIRMHGESKWSRARVLCVCVV